MAFRRGPRNTPAQARAFSWFRCNSSSAGTSTLALHSAQKSTPRALQPPQRGGYIMSRVAFQAFSSLGRVFIHHLPVDIDLFGPLIDIERIARPDDEIRIVARL